MNINFGDLVSRKLGVASASLGMTFILAQRTMNAPAPVAEQAIDTFLIAGPVLGVVGCAYCFAQGSIDKAKVKSGS